MDRTARRAISWGLVALVAVMPVHAFGSIWLGHLFAHQDLFQAWKELVIIAMAVAAGWLFLSDQATRAQWLTPVNLLALAFTFWALLITLRASNGDKATLVGLKTDLEFIAVFLIAQLAASRQLKITLTKTLLFTSGVVALLALVQLIAGADLLRHFGYGATTIDPVQRASGHLRIFSTLGGPNQLGAFLILPLSLTLALMLKRRRWWQPPALLIMLMALALTYSRSAWLGAAAALVTTAAVISRAANRRWALIAAGLLLIAALALSFGPLRGAVLHNAPGAGGSSDSKHLSAVGAGITEALHHPLGEGLGSAGPASYYGYVPNITENYYLQLAIETGLIGLALFLAFVAAVGLRLWQLRPKTGLAPPLLGALIGLSLVNLVLHGWADSSTAIVYWALAGTAIGTAG